MNDYDELNYLNYNHALQKKEEYYRKDPVYHLGTSAMKFHSPNEIRQLRERLEHEIAQKKPGYILSDGVALTWTNEIRHNKQHPILRFLHRVVWTFTPPESDIWKRWVLYRTRKELP